jgi:hypothetical protein
VASANGLVCSHSKALQIRWQILSGDAPLSRIVKKRSWLNLQFLKKFWRRTIKRTRNDSCWRKCASGGDLQTDLIKCGGRCVAKKPVGFSGSAGTRKEVYNKSSLRTKVGQVTTWDHLFSTMVRFTAPGVSSLLQKTLALSQKGAIELRQVTFSAFLVAGFLTGIGPQHWTNGARYVAGTTQLWLVTSDGVRLYTTSRLLVVMVTLVILLFMFIVHGSAEY